MANLAITELHKLLERLATAFDHTKIQREFIPFLVGRDDCALLREESHLLSI